MNTSLRFEKISDLYLKVTGNGNAQEWTELILTAMKTYPEVATAVISATKFYCDAKGMNFFEMLKDIDKKVAEMEKKKK